MGVVLKQGVITTVIGYIGMAIGYINLVLIFPVLLTPEEFGLTRVLLAAATVFGTISMMGLPSIILKFFYEFEHKNKQSVFLTFMIVWTLLGFIFFSLLSYLFKDFLIREYSENSRLFSENYYFVYPISFFMSFTMVFDTYARVVFKSVFSYFLDNVFIRLLWLLQVVLYYFQIISFETFLLFFSLSYVFNFGLNFWYLYLNGYVSFKKVKFKLSKSVQKIIKYSLFVFVGEGSVLLASKIDVLMVGSMVNLEEVAIYSVAFYIGTIVGFPSMAVGRVLSSIISKAWSSNNLEEIRSVYKETSKSQYILASVLLLLVFINTDLLVSFLPEEYSEGKMVFFYIGVSKIIIVLLGINGFIIQLSNKYQFVLWGNLVFLTTTVLFNYLLIPNFGINGAAIATVFAVLIFNLIKLGYTQYMWQINPYSKELIYITIINCIIFSLVYYLPNFNSIYLTSIYKSFFVVSGVFSLVYFFNLSKNITSHLNQLIRYIRLWK